MICFINKIKEIILILDKDENKVGIKACKKWYNIVHFARLLAIINAKDLRDI